MLVYRAVLYCTPCRDRRCDRLADAAVEALRPLRLRVFGVWVARVRGLPGFWAYRIRGNSQTRATPTTSRNPFLYSHVHSRPHSNPRSRP